MFTSRRHDDLKEMLDSNKDSLKLEAMKRIVAVSINNVYFGWSFKQAGLQVGRKLYRVQFKQQPAFLLVFWVT